MENVKTPYLYLLVRNDLPSLNPGKAVAHGAHAANQFVFENRWLPSRSAAPLFEQWEASTPQGFGTTITLHTSLKQIQAAVMVAKALGFPAGLTIDPTYPYIVNKEVFNLIPESVHTETPVFRGTDVVCFRKECTAAYVFGDKTDLQPVVGNFPLMP